MFKSIQPIWLIALLTLSGKSLSNELDIWAEEFAPFSYKDETGKLIGINTEIIEAMVELAGIEVLGWHMAPWARAFEEAKKRPNALLYTVTGTVERSDFFHWVGPLSKRKLNLYKLSKNKDLNISSWNDVRNHRIPSLRGAASTDDLRLYNVRVYELPSPRHIMRMLTAERAPLINMMDVSVAFLLRKEGLDPRIVEPVWTVDDSKSFYIGLNKSVSQEIVTKLQSAFAQLKQEGKVAEIQIRYLGKSLD